MRRRGILDVVRLIENDAPVGGQNGGLRVVLRRASYGEVGEQEVVVDHEELRGRGLPSGALIEALLKVAAPGPQTHVRIAPNLVPRLLCGRE